MSTGHRHAMFCWLALLLLGALELGCSYIEFDRSLRPVLLVPALGMVALVGVIFMRVRSGVAIVRGFALAGLVWLTLLLGLGTMDPMTRTMYVIQKHQIPR
jgi:cytochrome c oxidase subunit IV